MQPLRSIRPSPVPDDPFRAYRDPFLKHLESLHYRPSTVTFYFRCLDALAECIRTARVSLRDLDEDRAVDLIERAKRKSFHRRYAVRQFVRFLATSGATKPNEVAQRAGERDRLRLEYEEYLRVQRGLSERTIYHCWRFADRFLAFRFPQVPDDLSRITSLDIVRFLQHLLSQGKPLRDKTMPTHLRNFFQFLFRTGRTAINLAPSIPRVAQKYAARLPRSLTPDQVEQLLAAIPADTATGRRNYAMVLLLARLGLRASEVIAIRIDDLDWRKGELLIRGKGQRHDRLPLPPDVGEALANYIRRDRVTTSRALFVTERAPRLPFPDGQILNRVLKDAFAKIGVKPPTPYVGSHILRHTLAAALIRRGASLAEIGDMLRHRSPQSTMIYAKIDIDGLRSITHPWPTTGGAS